MLTHGDLLKAAKASYASYGKGLYKDGLHVAMTIGRGVSIAKRKHLFQGAMYSAILDEHVCSYCKSLDGLKLSLKHPDYVSGDYHPPQHKHCRCVWIYIGKDEPGIKFNWDKYKKGVNGSKQGKVHYHQGPGSKVMGIITSLFSKLRGRPTKKLQASMKVT